MVSFRADDPVMGWLLVPQEPAMRYLASRDLLRLRPGWATLQDLRVEPQDRPSKMITFSAVRALGSGFNP